MIIGPYMRPNHITKLNDMNIDALALARVLHYNYLTIGEIKKNLIKNTI